MLPEELETTRLLLRRASIGDADELLGRYTADPEVVRFMPWAPHADVAETTEFLRGREEAWDRNDGYSWTVRLRDTGRVAGMMGSSATVGHWASFGYVFARDTWGRGLATEAAGTVIEALRRVPHIYRIWATCDVENVASARVLEKVGLVREGLLHRWDRHNLSPDPRDCWAYATWRDSTGSWMPTPIPHP